MKKRRWLMLCGTLLIAGCMFPTTDDVNRMQDSEREYVGGLHDASNALMTEQHTAMTPELAEAFAAMKTQYNDLTAQLAAKAGEAKASGVDLGALGGDAGGIGIEWILGLFNLGWLYPFIKGFGKSRASTEVAKATEDITEIKLGLATAAKTGAAMPSDA